jgi:hypothetical protein
MHIRGIYVYCDVVSAERRKLLALFGVYEYMTLVSDYLVHFGNILLVPEIRYLVVIHIVCGFGVLSLITLFGPCVC